MLFWRCASVHLLLLLLLFPVAVRWVCGHQAVSVRASHSCFRSGEVKNSLAKCGISSGRWLIAALVQQPPKE
jgi:hypothetical protein